MPDSGAVYQPTTVGYSYDSGGDGTGGGGGLRHRFSRFRSWLKKLTLRQCLEWVLLSIALCLCVAGLTTLLVKLLSTDSSEQSDTVKVQHQGYITLPIKRQVNDTEKDSVALVVGMTMVSAGLVFGIACPCLSYFRGNKSPMNTTMVNSGQILDGLNLSTDLLVGSTSQYGIVLTEMSCQQSNSQDTSTMPLSDQEEETHTLMQDPASPPSVSIGSSTIANQIPG